LRHRRGYVAMDLASAVPRVVVESRLTGYLLS
jgi:hypothetical protein